MKEEENCDQRRKKKGKEWSWLPEVRIIFFLCFCRKFVSVHSIPFLAQYIRIDSGSQSILNLGHERFHECYSLLEMQSLSYWKDGILS